MTLSQSFSDIAYSVASQPNTPSQETTHGCYATEIGNILKPARNPRDTALDVYAGAGGFSLGLEAAGFNVAGIDYNKDCCHT